MVGGEQVRNEELQQKHSQRKKLADQRKEHLIRALTEEGEESENVLLDVYNSIQEEVYAKNQMLHKVQGKVGWAVRVGKRISVKRGFCSNFISQTTFANFRAKIF